MKGDITVKLHGGENNGAEVTCNIKAKTFRSYILTGKGIHADIYEMKKNCDPPVLIFSPELTQEHNNPTVDLS